MPSLSFVTLLPCFVAKTRKREFLGLRASCRWSRERVMHCAQEELKGPRGTDGEQRAQAPGPAPSLSPGSMLGRVLCKHSGWVCVPLKGHLPVERGVRLPPYGANVGRQTGHRGRAGGLVPRQSGCGAPALKCCLDASSLHLGLQDPGEPQVPAQGGEASGPWVPGLGGGRGGPSQLVVRVTQVILLPAAHAGQIIGCHSRTRTS